MAQWTRQKEERPGDYFFDGKGVMTQGVAGLLSPEEIAWIVADLKQAVAANDGLDYLQTVHSDDGRTVWAICQLSRSMKESGDYTPAQIEEYDYFTLLLPSDY